MMRHTAALAFAAMLACVTTLAFGQPVAQIAPPAESPRYPSKPIRMVAPDAGSGNDVMLRIVVPALSANLGQQIIIDNRGGAGGAIAMQTVARAQSDGYTLLSHGVAIWLLPFLRDKAPWDPLRDFAPITMTARVPNIIVVHPALSVQSVKELIAWAKARPGELNYGVAGGTGGATHLAAELFNSMANVNIVRINYKGAVPAIADLIGGRVQLMFPTASSVMPHIKAGRMKALAVTTAQPSIVVPDLPTVSATGLPGYESGGIYAMMAPAGTPSAVIELMNREMLRVLGGAEIREKLAGSGVEIVGSSPRELTATMKSEMARMGKVIRDAGIREE